MALAETTGIVHYVLALRFDFCFVLAFMLDVFRHCRFTVEYKTAIEMLDFGV